MDDQIGGLREKDRAAAQPDYEWKYFAPNQDFASNAMQTMDSMLADVKERRGEFEASLVEGMVQTRLLITGMHEKQAGAWARVQARTFDAVFKQVWPGDHGKAHELIRESTAITDKLFSALLEKK